MARQDATPKQTGGGGFAFEDEVVAYFLLHLLAGLPPFEHVPHGLARVDAQEAASDWHLDDLVLTLDTLDGPARVAISVKSNDQFTGGTFPADFVHDAWEQVLQISSSAFEPDRDLLGFITAPSPSVRVDLDTLLDRARNQSPADLARDLHKPRRSNDAIRGLHDSAECPVDIADGRGELYPGQVLRPLVWMPFDLDSAPSTRRARAKEIAQSLVSSGTPEDAETLYNLVARAASKLRTTSGDMDREQLISRLRPHIALRERPDHRADWDRIRAHAEEALALIPHTIGGTVELPRLGEREAIEEVFPQTGAVALLGASGVGKTVLARLVALDALGEDHRVVWADATGLAQGSLNQRLSLTQTFRDLTRHAAGAGGLLVLDRLDRVHQDAALRNAVALLHAVGLGEGAEPHARWRVVATCTPEAWDHVQARLLRFGVPPEVFTPVQISPPDSEDLMKVWDAFSALRPLRFRRHLSTVFLRPKVLDLFASKARLSLDLETVGESHLAAWFWETEVEVEAGGIDRGLAALTLARIQADELAPSTSITSGRFDAGERGALGALAADRVLAIREGRAEFDHDLYGDWVRLRDLRRAEVDGGLTAFLTGRLQSPVWQRALRLYGLHLLEQDGGLNAWQTAFGALTELDGQQGQLAGDLLLEASALAGSSADSLNTLWPALVAEEGALLDRLLQRFLHSATLPNPVVLEGVREQSPAEGGAADPSLETYLAANARVPYWPYWYAPLLVLHAHKDEIPVRATASVARMVDLWLRFTTEGWSLRDEAADLALTLGERLLRSKQEHSWTFRDGVADRAVHRALLAASPVRTEEATALLLEAAGRQEQRFRPPPATEEEIAEGRAELRRRGVPVGSLFGSGPMPDPWPDGPAVRVDEALQHVVLETDALQPLIEIDPRAAKELLLALLIEQPRERSYSSSLGDYGLEHPRWYPPFYTRGPFRAFLALDEEHGIDAILRLVGHVTERRVDVLAGFARERGEGYAPPSLAFVTEDGERTFVGDQQAFLWHLQGPDSSGVTASALMALEKYLYDRIDAEDDVTVTVERLLMESDSLAIVGLLTTVGRYDPILFKGPLRSLLTSPELLAWTLLGSRGEGWQTAIGGFMGRSLLPEPLHDAYRAWHQMKHRGWSLREIGVLYFLRDESFEETYAEARERWAEDSRESGRYEGWSMIENLLAQFDRANYVPVTDEAGRAALQYVAPPELQAKADEEEQANQQELLVMTLPVQCHQILESSESEPDEDALWASAEQLAPLEDARWDRAPASPLDARAGIAAVLVSRCGVRAGERFQWARAQLLQSAYAVRETLGGLMAWEAQAFAADALPVLWSLDPQDSDLREAVAHVVSSGSTDLVHRLTSSVKAHRSGLRDDHLRLLHLVSRRAANEHDLRRRRRSVEWHRSSDTDEAALLEAETELAALEAVGEQDVQAFLDGSLASELPPLKLGTVPSETPSLRRNAPRRERPHRLTDEGLLVAAYNGVPLPQEAGPDWPTWASLWSRVVAHTADSLALTPDAETRDTEGADGPWERFVWTHAVYLSSVADTDTEARTYWEPILALGPTASFSVSSFLREWWGWVHGRPNDDTLARRSGQMVEFASEHPRWSREDRYGWHPRAELWRLVVGLQNLSSEVWTSEQTPLAEGLNPCLRRWATDHPLNADDLVALSTFLSLPAARGARLDGLPWIAEAVQDRDDVWAEHLVGDASPHSRVETAVGQLLVAVWTTDEAELRRHETAFEAFQMLLGVLTARQLPVALELSQRVGLSSQG